MINDIKAKLPSNKKGSERDDDHESSFTSGDRTDPNGSASDDTDATNNQSKSLLSKLKSKMGKKDSSSSVGKRKTSPLLVIAILGAAAFFLIDAEEPAPEVATPAPISKKIAKVELSPADTTVLPEATDTASTVEPEASAETPAETPTEAPVDPAVTDPSSVTSETPSESAVDPSVTASPTDTPTELSPVPEESSLSDLLPPEETPTAPPASIDSIDGDVVTDDSTTTDRILNDLEKQVKRDQVREVKKEYVNPPDYEYKGRGLVYNCAGKHWACVDAPSFKSCEDNFSSVNFLRKTVECYPFNVYQSSKGCEAMQNRVVSSNAKTNFCKGN